jgi:hypothetical protein
VAAQPPGLAARLKTPPTVALPPLEGRQPAVDKGGAMVAGTHRSLPSNSVKRGGWTKLPGGGSVWRVALKTPGAEGVRIHFTQFDAAKGRVWIYAERDLKPEVAGPYTGPNRDGDFWSGTVFSDTVIVEYQPPAGARASGAPPFQIPEISHLWGQ